MFFVAVESETVLRACVYGKQTEPFSLLNSVGFRFEDLSNVDRLSDIDRESAADSFASFLKMDRLFLVYGLFKFHLR